ncbi:MAG: D-amino-acid transaminase [Bacteroidales bacterium]|nr:D-amino-acid transaminase [Bacteroidales bacterium]
MLQHSTIYLNGQFMGRDKAMVSPEDRGFYFADGVYEVVKYYKGKPFCFEEHLNRFKDSLSGVKIRFENTAKLRDVCDALIKANSLSNKYAGVYIQVTRGVASRTHRFPEGNIEPTVFARAFTMPTYLNEMRDGIRLVTHEDIRWQWCNIKSIALLPNTIIFEEAATQGAFECMLIRNGYITEATHSNIMAVKNGTVYTHPESNLILSGITRLMVLQLCNKLNIPVVEEPINATKIGDYDEWFVCGTGSEIVPVIKIDDTPVANAKPGPVTRLLQHEFLRITYEELAGEKIVLDA